MSHGFRQSRALDRRRRRVRVLKWLLVIAVLGALGATAYRTGSELAEREVRRLDREVEELNGKVAALQAENAQLRGDSRAAQAREAQLQRQYTRDVPTGAPRALLDRIETRLKDGVPADRLRFMIDSATAEPVCDGKPVTKRFFVRTPIFEGANDAAAFADRTITVTATGASATNASGAVEAWFDPAKPVTLLFTPIGGKALEIAGVLPLHRSVVYNGHEYRFSATTTDRRGFVEVTADRCDFPLARPEGGQ